MKKLLLLLFILSILAMQSCAPHYVPSQCPAIEPPPQTHNTQWVKITFIDDTGKEIVYYALPAREAKKEKLNIEVIKEYTTRCYELNK